MKVLLANKFFYRKGGSEAVMFMERDFLRDAGVEIVDFSMRDPRNLPSSYAEAFVARQTYGENRRRRPLHRLAAALKLIHSPEAVRRMGQLIDRTKPDLVHCHNIYHQLTPSIFRAAKRRRVPVLLTLHDYKPICPVYTRLRHGRPCSACIEQQFFNVVRYRCADGSSAQSALLYAEALAQRVLHSYEQLDAVVAPSDFMRRSVTRALFPEDRVHVIYNGVDTRRIARATEDDGYALYLGRLAPEKGIETLLAAHERISRRVPLRIAGTGPLEAELRSRYPQVSFLGHLSGRPLAEALRRAALIVVPSEWYENCPISVLEAMAYGKPVVASKIGGIPELVVHGETGLLFPPGDRDALAEGLARLMQNADRRRRYGEAARGRAERHFSLEKHGCALLNLYTNVLESQTEWRKAALLRHSN